MLLNSPKYWTKKPFWIDLERNDLPERLGHPPLHERPFEPPHGARCPRTRHEKVRITLPVSRTLRDALRILRSARLHDCAENHIERRASENGEHGVFFPEMKGGHEGEGGKLADTRGPRCPGNILEAIYDEDGHDHRRDKPLDKADSPGRINCN